MKRIIIAAMALTLISVGATKAQTNQGNILVGVSTTLSMAGTGSDLMNIGFSSMKYKSDASGFDEPDADKTIGFNLLPKVGYFVIDNLAVGLDISTAYSKDTDGYDDDTQTATIFSAGPFLRYYMPNEKVMPYVELGGSFGGVNSKYESGDGDYDSDSKSSIMNFGGGIGIAAPLGNNVTFDFLAGYNSFTVKDKEDNDDNDRVVIGTLGIKFGFTIILGDN